MRAAPPRPSCRPRAPPSPPDTSRAARSPHPTAGNFLSPAEQLSSNGFRTVLEIDALGTFNASRAAFEALRASGDACIINISMTLHYGATWWQAHASAAKVRVCGGACGVGGLVTRVFAWLCVRV